MVCECGRQWEQHHSTSAWPMGHIKASLCWQTKESGKPKKNKMSKMGKKRRQKKRRRKKNSGTETWTGRQTLSAFLLSNAVKRLQSCKGSPSAPENALPGSQDGSQLASHTRNRKRMSRWPLFLFLCFGFRCHSLVVIVPGAARTQTQTLIEISRKISREEEPVSDFDSDSGMPQFVMHAIYHVCNCVSPDQIRSNESRVTSVRCM